MPIREQWIISTRSHLGPSGAGGRVLRRLWASVLPERWGVGRPPSMSFLHQDLPLKRESVIWGSPNSLNIYPINLWFDSGNFLQKKKMLILEDVLHKHSLVSSKMGLRRPGISNLTHLMSAWQRCILKNCALIILWGLGVRMCWVSTWMCWVTQHRFFGETYPFPVSAGLGCPFWCPVPSSSEVNIQLWLNLF